MFSLGWASDVGLAASLSKNTISVSIHYCQRRLNSAKRNTGYYSTPRTTNEHERQKKSPCACLQ
jgi:hypothetical protein